jgi:glucosamine--fructose-6-phosphate aminotransferase (isomerizing)
MTTPLPTLMLREAAEAAEIAARLAADAPRLVAPLAKALRASPPDFVMTCARGSSDHAATYAKYLFETMGLASVASHGPSVSSLYQAPMRARNALFLAISQSGRSPDLVAATAAARDAGATTVAFVNQDGSPLAAAAKTAFPLLAGPENSVAATKSCIAAMAAIGWLAAAWAEDRALAAALAAAPDALARTWAADWPGGRSFLADDGGLFVIGRGLNFAIAQEAALKLKETSALHAEAISAAEVRHGPMTIVREGFRVLMFAPADAAQAGFDRLASDFVARGARVAIIGGAGVSGALHLPVPAAPHPALAPILALSRFYRLAEETARARGFDPDRPPFLSKVTETH